MQPSVIVIGAGFGGLAVAHHLRAAGVTDITILERADDIGGVWRDNVYPGAACDVPSVLYSWSFAPKADWTHRYARQPEGALYTFGWKEDDGSITWDPMNGEPLQLVPRDQRQAVCDALNEGRGEHDFRVEIEGDVCPLSRYYFKQRLEKYAGDKPKTADELGIALKTLYNKLNQYQAQDQAEAG